MGEEAIQLLDLGKLRDIEQDLVDQLDVSMVLSCFMCRTCTSSCPVTFAQPRFNPLAIIRLVAYGFIDEVLSSDMVWLCSSCYSCQERCPQGIPIADFMNKLKNCAVQKGYAPAGVRAQMDLIRTSGRIYPLDDFDNKKRVKAGLPSLPTSCEIVEKLLDRA